MTGLHFHPLRVRSIAPDTDEALLVSFEVPVELRETFTFRPGQYLTLRGEVDGQDLRRSYSICSGLDDGALRVGIRKVGVFSNWVETQVKPGESIQVIPPQGHFTLPEARVEGRHVLGIAGGSGITPILSIMKSLLAREPGSCFTLIYANRRAASTMFKEEIEDLKNRHLTRLVIFPVFSQEITDSPLASGRLTREKLGTMLCTLIAPLGIDHAFVCGPYGFNEDAEAVLLEAGVAPARIHIERFGAPLPQPADALQHEARPEDAAQAKVVIIRDGLTREIAFRSTDPSILDAASAAGLDVPYSCKSGVCCTCRAKLIEGKVRMDRNFALERHEVEAGFVLTCQSHPLTDRVVVSYDER